MEVHRSTGAGMGEVRGAHLTNSAVKSFAPPSLPLLPPRSGERDALRQPGGPPGEPGAVSGLSSRFA